MSTPPKVNWIVVGSDSRTPPGAIFVIPDAG